MTSVYTEPCREAVIRSRTADAVCQSRVWVLAAAVLGSSMAFIDGTVVNVALPAISADLGADTASLQWIVESYALFLATLLLVGGAMGDRHGRRLTFTWGAALFALASLACALAPNSATLIAARAVQGMAGAFMVPASLALIAASYPKEERGRAIGAWSAATALMMAVGPVAGGWLTEHLSWRYIFYLNLPIAVLTLAIAFSAVPESKNEEDHAPFDWTGAALAVVGLGVVVFGLIEANRLALTHPLVWGSVVIGLVLLGLFVAQERRTAHAMTPPDLFRRADFTGVNLLTFLLYGAFGGTLFFLPFFMISVHGYQATQAAAAFLPFVIVMSLFSRVSGGLVDRLGSRLPLTVGPAIVGLGFLLMTVIGTQGSYWFTFFPAILTLSVGMVITVAPLTATVMAAVPDERGGVASGINNAVSRTAGLMSIALFGVLFSLTANQALSDELARVSSGEAAAILDKIRFTLGSLSLPNDLPVAVYEDVRTAGDSAFVAGFRWVARTAAILAALAALTGWLSLAKPAVTPQPAK